MDYDRQQRQAVATSSSPVTSPRDAPVLKQQVKKPEKIRYVVKLNLPVLVGLLSAVQLPFDI